MHSFSQRSLVQAVDMPASIEDQAKCLAVVEWLRKQNIEVDLRDEDGLTPI
jgi:hypothetical protein